MDGSAWSGGTWMIDQNDPRCPDFLFDIVQRLRAPDRVEAFATRWDEPTTQGCYVLSRELLYMASNVYIFGRELPIAAIVVDHAWPARFQVAMLATDDIGRIILHVTHFVRDAMIPGLIAVGAQRAQVASHAGHSVSHRWLKLLGAEHESTLRNFGKDGADYLIFRWLRAAS